MKGSRPRVVITGMAVVSAAGCDLERFWAHLVSGRSAVAPIRRFDASAYPSRIAAEVRAQDLVPHRSDEAVVTSVPVDWSERGRMALFAAQATAAALIHAGLPLDATTRARTGIAMATGMGTYGHLEVFKASAAGGHGDTFGWPDCVRVLREQLRPLALARRNPGSIAADLARQFGCGGPVMAVMTACAGGTQAIGDAARWLRAGRADAAIAGGADSELYPMGLASFCLLGALSTRNDEPARASRPFDAQRDGFVMGEGAGIVILETLEHAERRGARIWAEVAGFGSASDAYRVTDLHPDGTGAVLAMTRALAHAELSPGDVDYVNAHGTSTATNDRVETRALHRVFGERASTVPISSTKSMIGHATVAAGAIEAVVTALTLANQVIHPTINYDTPDPSCDLDYVPNAARPARVESALSNSLAFGGQSACLALRRWNG